MGVSNGAVSHPYMHPSINLRQMYRILTPNRPLDSLVTFSKTKGSPSSCTSGSAPVRYAVRQVLDQEYRKEVLRKHSETLNSSTIGKNRPSRKSTDGDTEKDASAKNPLRDISVKRDFFGRIIQQPVPAPNGSGSDESQPVQNEASKAGRKVWVTYHDGYSNAVRKPISMGELLAGL